MARPVNADAEATRARVLHSALTLFSEHGVGNTSIREIARGADVSLAMVHHYFGSKDELYDACIASMYVELTEMRVDLEQALASGGSLAELIERAVVASFHFARAHRTAVRLMLRSTVETGQYYPRGRDALFPFLDSVSEAIGAVIGRPAHELRLPLQTIIFVIARYSIHDEAELAQVAGPAMEKRDEKARVDLIERHLIEMARALLQLPARAAHTSRNQS